MRYESIHSPSLSLYTQIFPSTLMLLSVPRDTWMAFDRINSKYTMHFAFSAIASWSALIWCDCLLAWLGAQVSFFALNMNRVDMAFQTCCVVESLTGNVKLVLKKHIGVFQSYMLIWITQIDVILLQFNERATVLYIFITVLILAPLRKLQKSMLWNWGLWCVIILDGITICGKPGNINCLAVRLPIFCIPETCQLQASYHDEQREVSTVSQYSLYTSAHGGFKSYFRHRDSLKRSD